MSRPENRRPRPNRPPRRRDIKRAFAVAALAYLWAFPFGAQGSTVVGTRRSVFTINGHTTYTTEWWNPQLPGGPHVLHVAAFNMRGPRFTEPAAILEVPFVVLK